MSQSRIKRTTLANIRQQLQAPAQALLEYSNMLVEHAMHLKADALVPDLNRITTAATQMTLVIRDLLNDDAMSKLAHGNESSENMIRHELRTPINAIKGYSEMLLEDLPDFGAESLQPDLEKILVFANRLLTDINSYIQFSTSQPLAENSQIDVVSVALSSDLVESIRAIECEGEHCPPEAIETNITGHILVVDDIEPNRDLLARRLQKDGHTTVCAAGGIEALAKLRDNEFDLVLLDLMMPDMNGYEVLTQMRKDKATRQIPVIMISALEETDSVIRCIEAGAVDYLQKPFNPILLQARINSGLLNKQWSDDERKQRRFIKQAFSRFVSPAVVNQLLEQPEKLKLGGERVELSCVFTDLAGFTAAIEDAEPSEIMPVLNQYLSALCNIVIEHDGTIDKIIGDAVYVFFNAPLPREDHAEAAVKCAMAIEKWSNEFMHDDAAKRFNFGKTRIGVHTGSAIVGNFGGDAFFNYTAYGDTINTTARLEGANKHLGTLVCISEATVARCKSFTFRPVGKLLLKGKTKAVLAYTLNDNNYDSDFLEQYSKALNALTSGLVNNDKQTLEDLFYALVKQKPNDPLSELHLRRIQSGVLSDLIIVDKK